MCEYLEYTKKFNCRPGRRKILVIGPTVKKLVLAFQTISSFFISVFFKMLKQFISRRSALYLLVEEHRRNIPEIFSSLHAILN